MDEFDFRRLARGLRTSPPSTTSEGVGDSLIWLCLREVRSADVQARSECQSSVSCIGSKDKHHLHGDPACDIGGLSTQELPQHA